MPKASAGVYESKPYHDGSAVTPSDATVFAPPFRALYVGVAGAVAVTTLNGTDVVFAAVPARTVLPIVGTKVKATGTAASSIVALY